jgi:hypothetical protein
MLLAFLSTGITTTTIYTNDMNVAMTGDMVIRIAQGTTVARGDLLMTAGDGTAKPQGDDIVRSKTIAKGDQHHMFHIHTTTAPISCRAS